MKKKIKLFTRLMVIVFILCFSVPVEAKSKQKYVAFTEKSNTICVKDTAEVPVMHIKRVSFIKGSFQSSNKKIVSVNSKTGKYKAKKVGRATISFVKYKMNGDVVVLKKPLKFKVKVVKTCTRREKPVLLVNNK